LIADHLPGDRLRGAQTSFNQRIQYAALPLGGMYRELGREHETMADSPLSWHEHGDQGDNLGIHVDAIVVAHTPQLHKP